MSVATTGRRPATADGRGRVLPRVTPAILLVLLALTGPYLAADRKSVV